MKNMLKLMAGGFTLIRRDTMMVLLLLGPWLAGAALGIGLPILAPWLLSALNFDITPWYPLADAMLLLLTPMMAGMLAGFLMLDERDEGVGAYYPVTPIGYAGYLVSRLSLPVLWSILVAPLLMALFSLSHPAIPRVLGIAVIGGLSASASALLLVTFAKNKVEGLAVSKLMGIMMLPVLVPFFTGSPWGMAAGVFPAYWMGLLVNGDLIWLLPGILVSGIWLWLLYARMSRRQV